MPFRAFLKLCSILHSKSPISFRPWALSIISIKSELCSASLLFNLRSNTIVKLTITNSSFPSFKLFSKVSFVALSSISIFAVEVSLPLKCRATFCFKMFVMVILSSIVAPAESSLRSKNLLL